VHAPVVQDKLVEIRGVAPSAGERLVAIPAGISTQSPRSCCARDVPDKKMITMLSTAASLAFERLKMKRTFFCIYFLGRSVYLLWLNIP
jgi:hypothetical protein